MLIYFYVTLLSTLCYRCGIVSIWRLYLQQVTFIYLYSTLMIIYRFLIFIFTITHKYVCIEHFSVMHFHDKCLLTSYTFQVQEISNKQDKFDSLGI